MTTESIVSRAPHDGEAVRPTVSFVIPVKDDASRLERSLRAILANADTAAAVEVIVADNGSSDESPKVARALGATVMVHPGISVAQLRNRAARAARGDVLAFIDADNLIVPTWLNHAMSTLSLDRVGLVGALYHSPDPGTWVQRIYGILRGRTRGTSDVDWLASGNMAVWRDVFEQVGGFDEALATCEDVELCQRIKQLGRRIVANEQLQSVHLGDPPTLRAVFASERWRGRDNLRVAVKNGLTLRDVPSVFIPVIGVVLMVAASAGALLLPIVGSRALVWIASSLAAFLGLVALRAFRIARSGRFVHPLHWLQAMAVATAYDAGRAMALITRSRHHRRDRLLPQERPST